MVDGEIMPAIAERLDLISVIVSDDDDDDDDDGDDTCLATEWSDRTNSRVVPDCSLSSNSEERDGRIRSTSL